MKLSFIIIIVYNVIDSIYYLENASCIIMHIGMYVCMYGACITSVYLRLLPFDIYTHCINLHNRRCLEHTAAVHAPLGLRFRVHVALHVYIIIRMHTLRGCVFHIICNCPCHNNIILHYG